MNKKCISKKLGSDFRRLRALREADIDTSEILEVSPELFARAVVRQGLKPVPPKIQLTIRIDRDVLDWYRKQGRGYQTRINRLLRAYMEAHRKGVA